MNTKRERASVCVCMCVPNVAEMADIRMQECVRVSERVCMCVCVCVCSPGRFNPALISQFYQSIQCFVHHVSSLSTINGNVPCDTVHLIKVVCLTIRLCALMILLV